VSHARGASPARRAALAALALGAAAGPLAPRADEAVPAGPRAEAGEEIVVTATRSPRPLRDVPSAVTVLPRAEIERSPSKTTDELLRIVPSFGLFRRTSSVVSDPTAQGVNLRGIGPSGVSRSLVLVDGMSANDPFGGWVYWRALPRLGIERIEVVPGGGSALYGNYAMGGVVQVLSRPITPRSLEATAQLGTADTGQAGVRVADVWGPVGAVIEGEAFRSSGYPVVASSLRGPVDTAAASEHAAVNARLEARASPDLSFTLRGGWFYEDQNGGTRYTTAEVRRLDYAASARWEPGAAGTFDLTLSGHRNGFEQDRARILASRTIEERASTQRIPTHDAGGELLWTSLPLPLAGTHTLNAGADARRITATVAEDRFPPATTVRLDVDGEQRLYGAFVQDLYDVTDRVALSLALRWDGWDTRASRAERAVDGTTTAASFPRRGDDVPSPKVALRVRAHELLVLRASAYGAFRAPTLNELYRPFQVGPVITDPNPSLGPERLRGAEAGFEIPAPFGLVARLTGFWNELDGAITNVTLEPNRRRRENLGSARIRGIEAEVGWRLAGRWFATAAYTLADSEVTSAPGQPQLVGKDLLQDPRHRASASLAFQDPRLLSAAVQLRYVGRQYEDDVNALPMKAVALVDVSASRRIGRSLALVLAVENLLDEEYLVGRAGGVDTIGQPRFVHAGLHLRFGG